MNHEHTMNREHIMNREQGRIAGCREGGFTAIELVVALGIFSVIAIISSVAMINTFAGIRQVSEGTELQVQAQNSAEWVSRLLRYTDQVPGTESAIVSAGPHDITFSKIALGDGGQDFRLVGFGLGEELGCGHGA